MVINDIKFITVAFIRYQNTQPIINGAKNGACSCKHVRLCEIFNEGKKLPIDNLLHHKFILQE